MDKAVLSIDVETYCELDIKNVGAYKYCEHPSFEILLFAYAFNDEPVQIIDLMNVLQKRLLRINLFPHRNI